MDAFLERVYLGQAKQECEACYVAIQAFNQAANGDDDPFIHAITFVHRAASISRIFWPPGGFKKESRLRSQRRGDHLRSSLKIGADHPIQSRTLRDNFEHFDERLDEWAEESKNKNLVHKFIGPRSAVRGIEDGDIILHYDPTTKIFAFRGQKFDLQALVNGVTDISSRIETRLNAIEAMR